MTFRKLRENRFDSSELWPFLWVSFLALVANPPILVEPAAVLLTEWLDCGALCADYPKSVHAKCLNAPVPLPTVLDPSREVDLLALRLNDFLATSLDDWGQLRRRLLILLLVFGYFVVLEDSTTLGKITCINFINQDGWLWWQAILGVDKADGSAHPTLSCDHFWCRRILLHVRQPTTLAIQSHPSPHHRLLLHAELGIGSRSTLARDAVDSVVLRSFPCETLQRFVFILIFERQLALGLQGLAPA